MKASEYLLEGLLSEQKISQITGLTLSKIKSLSKRLQKTGQIFPFMNKKNGKLNSDHEEFLIHQIEGHNGCILSLSEMKKKLWDNFPHIQNISSKTLSNYLKKLGYTYKKISPSIDKRNFVANQTKQLAVAKQLITLLSQDYSVMFVDETGVSLNCCPNYGWGKKGKKISLEIKGNLKNYSIMAAITKKQVLGCQIIQKGGTTKEDFLGFVCSMIQEYFTDTLYNEIIVFCDNASSHTSPFIPLHAGNKITFVFNAPYTPMLNPIEEFFSKFKHSIKKEWISDEKQLLQAVITALNSFKPNDIKGYVRHVLHIIQSLFEGTPIT